jgi:hypothetical protein
MKSLRIFSIAIIFGLFATAGQTSLLAQEREGLDREEQERMGQGQQEQRQGRMQGQERSIEVNQLPQAVKETLQEEYQDWTPAEAFLASDPEEGTFYKVKLNNTQEGETKTVKISTDGEVIDEMEGEQSEGQKQKDGREYTPVSFVPDHHKGQGRQGRQGQEGQHGRQGQEGQHGQHGMEGQRSMDEYGRSIDVDQLPQAVQETLQEDYEEWRPTAARIVTDPEEYEEGSFYQVILNKTDEGEQENKIVKISTDGEVIDEEDLDEDGWFDGDEGLFDGDNDEPRDRRY